MEGAQHIPADGPFILVPNHSSFADHFILDAILDALRPSFTYYLTKAESFVHPLRSRWTVAMGGIPVNREQPSRELLAAVDTVFAEGSTLVVYAEGTRGPGWPLLPLKDGAFRFAVRSKIPVIPVGMWGNQHILPKGANLPRRATTRVVFGPPLAVDSTQSRSARVAALTQSAAAALENLVDLARNPTAERDRASAQQLADRAEATIETMLSHTDTQPPALRVHQARTLLSLAARLDPDNADVRVTRARLTGLRAMDASVPLRLALLPRVRSGAARVVEKHPDHLMAHYLLGRWNLMTPRLLGGRTSKAVTHFGHTVRIAPHDTRYPMAHAEALIAAGDTAAAARQLARIVSTPAPDPRTADRRQRAAALYQKLTNTPAPDSAPDSSVLDAPEAPNSASSSNSSSSTGSSNVLNVPTPATVPTPSIPAR
ncbi:lysophospholipid acyltransferase family protein [Streptomyces sp. NBC_01190]|uniref:lysophospholipid acyltransferase family protein n=1 Tax=Streptomyces sp. NBC_01190 TaxID=2903767 RepID=UPI0038638EE3|nr:1-acyl-sn-glycerol-3-phosphate acyltransferase [Streptomyces sp. NBC_01190]